MSYGSIYEVTWWGSPLQNGWGGIYFDLAGNTLTPFQQAFKSRVEADGGTVESIECVTETIL
tara:strand:+ start:31 stop:216 length:186 start_codon:yes stop_codon:yes gene_type:complete